MILLCRAVICSNRQTTVVSDTVWPQFEVQVLTRGCELPVWGKSGRFPLARPLEPGLYLKRFPRYSMRGCRCYLATIANLLAVVGQYGLLS